MDPILKDTLQWLGGSLFLLNKIFLSFSERATNKAKDKTSRSFRAIAWLCGVIGLPAWLIIFADLHDWIAGSVEASGLPAVVLAMVMAVKGRDYEPPRWLDRTAILCMILGVGCSLWDFGGLNQLSQWLEVGVAIGFLVGTYMLAKEQPLGYIFYIFMHLCCARLMWIQDYPWLFWQQVASLVFIVDAYYTTRRRKKVVLETT